MGSVFGSGPSVQAVKPPKPIQLDINQLEQNMVGADQAAYNAADQYMNQFYPALAQGRNNAINQAFQAVTGPLNPQLENTFVNQGNMQSIQALGAGNQSFGTGGGKSGGATGAGAWADPSGSLARGSAAATVAQEEQGYQDTARQTMEQMNNMFSPRSFGMTPQDAANIFTFNNTQYNNYLQQLFAGQTNAYYQNAGLSAGAAASQTGLIGGIGSSIIAAIPAIIVAL